MSFTPSNPLVYLVFLILSVLGPVDPVLNPCRVCFIPLSSMSSILCMYAGDFCWIKYSISMALDIQKKMNWRSGTRSEMLSRDSEAGSWLYNHTKTHIHRFDSVTMPSELVTAYSAPHDLKSVTRSKCTHVRIIRWNMILTAELASVPTPLSSPVRHRHRRQLMS